MDASDRAAERAIRPLCRVKPQRPAAAADIA
jgi:hypothetical protein